MGPEGKQNSSILKLEKGGWKQSLSFHSFVRNKRGVKNGTKTERNSVTKIVDHVLAAITSNTQESRHLMALKLTCSTSPAWRSKTSGGGPGGVRRNQSCPSPEKKKWTRIHAARARRIGNKYGIRGKGEDDHPVYNRKNKQMAVRRAKKNLRGGEGKGIGQLRLKGRVLVQSLSGSVDSNGGKKENTNAENGQAPAPGGTILRSWEGGQGGNQEIQQKYRGPELPKSRNKQREGRERRHAHRIIWAWIPTYKKTLG